MRNLLLTWQFWAILSAGFAALTAIFGKIGVASLKTDLELRSGTAAFTDDDTATDVAWGLGIGWKVAPRWLVQLEYERFRPEVLGEKAWVQFTSLGAAYRF